VTVYVLDADVFIEAKKRHYPFDVVPAYWDWIDREHANGIVFSVDKVRDELLALADDLSTWAQARPSLFLKPDAPVVTSLAVLSSWAMASGYDLGAKTQFLASGDYYLIAHAHAHGCTIVTHELPGQGSLKKIKIPDACSANGVTCVNTWQMLRAEKARFVL
jgi:hypothetical protein